LEFMKLASAWWRCTNRPLLRSLPSILLALVWVVVAGGASVLSSEITKAASLDRLIMSPSCGTWKWNTANETTKVDTFAKRELQDTNTAAAYARACYDTDSIDQLECNIYTQKRLPYTVDYNSTCPFKNNSCLEGNTAAYQIDTGLLDSQLHLGINTRPDKRVQFRKVVSCSPLRMGQQFITILNGTYPPYPGDLVIAYDYGEVGTGLIAQNHTFLYNVQAKKGQFGYKI
jgi:hypothetical protein